MTAAVCEAFSEELVAYLDGEQPDAERARIDAHVGTCLTCRRELERLRRVRALLGELRPIEPSDGFDEAMWRRLDATPARTTGRRRAVLWAAPLLAAAAGIALAWYSSITRLTSQIDASRGGGAVAQAPRDGDTQVAEHAPAREEQGGQPAVVTASDDLEQYPPELVEHPELFLRYPVVRRLQKLEHFEEVKQHGDGSGGEPVGALAPEMRPIG